jgi:type IV pilus assembly protein PilB
MTVPGTVALRDAWLGPYLVQAGLVPEERLAGLATDGGQLWQAAVNAGLTTDQEIVEALARRFRLPVADLSKADPRAAAVLPEAAARKFGVLVLGQDERVARIATSDPRDLEAEQSLAFITGRDVQLEVGAPEAIREKLDEFYRPENSINRLLKGLAPTDVEVEAPIVTDDRDPALDAPMAKLVDALMADAVRAGASDIHSELEGTNVIVRYRVDGILREVMRLPEAAGPSLVRRVKIIAGLDVTNSMTPQDGRSTVKVDGKSVDLRIATAPVARKGEKLVIRILDKTRLRTSIPDLALPPEEERVLMQMLGHREGMVLVTGPTGSGKTTTLYAVLNHLKTGKVNIVTVEDPVEYDVDGISQMQVNEAQGFTFATALRSVLRQDPDIVLVGEIRDVETATIAIQAGLTGHFVFSTLHTNDAVSAIARLRDMGVDSFKISSALRGVLAQRLVRRLCERCAEPMPIEEVPAEARPPADYAGRFAPRRAPGCKVCGGTGYRDRLSVMELLPIEGKVSDLIEAGALPQAILEAARPHGLRTLWESGLNRFWSGLTSYDEIRRVLGESRDRDAQLAERASGAAAPASPARPVGTGTASEGGTVLLADDDPQMRKLVKMVLEREGFTIIEAADGLDTLDAIQTHPIDLVLLDQDMPRLTGLGVLEELRARVETSGLPVIMLTARTDETESEALALGAQDYLTKPVQPRSLVARVKAVLKRTRMV